jgi:hypothetical protein
MAECLRAIAPRELMDHHDGFVGSVICGLLFRQGLDTPRTLKKASGTGIERVVQRISNILSDPPASAWYFMVLDRLSIDHIGAPFLPRDIA